MPKTYKKINRFFLRQDRPLKKTGTEHSTASHIEKIILQENPLHQRALAVHAKPFRTKCFVKLHRCESKNIFKKKKFTTPIFEAYVS